MPSAAASAAAAPAAAPSAAAAPAADPGPSPLAGTTGGAAASRPLVPARVPPGWKPYVAPDGSYALALPAGYRSSGPRRFVSASGLTVVTVRSGPLAQTPTVADVRADAKRFAAGHPGYRTLAVRRLPYRGVAAATWDFRYGAGSRAQQVSDLAVAVDGTGYGLRVQARESAWRFAAPVRDGIRSSFAVPGLA